MKTYSEQEFFNMRRVDLAAYAFQLQSLCVQMVAKVLRLEAQHETKLQEQIEIWRNKNQALSNRIHQLERDNRRLERQLEDLDKIAAPVIAKKIIEELEAA